MKALSAGTLHRNRNYLLGALAASLLLTPGAANAVLIPGDQAGVFAEGSIRSRFLICTTCSPVADLLDEQEAGSFGNNGPAIVAGAGGGGTGTADYDARAIIFGPSSGRRRAPIREWVLTQASLGMAPTSSRRPPA
jgi:hypothetical protein